MHGLRLIVYHRHDLPPKWDDRHVNWEPWGDAGTHVSLACRAPDRERACEQCGLIDAPTRTTSGRTQERMLIVLRCECGHDVVHDALDGTWWDLDADDYGRAGSHEYSETLF